MVHFDPWGKEPKTDGAALLQEVRDWLATYISTVTEADLDLLTLWAAHTHLVIETYTTPRLQLDSPVPGSGQDDMAGTSPTALPSVGADGVAFVAGSANPDAQRRAAHDLD